MNTNEELRAEDMTPEQQIERLIRQRNELWRLLELFAMEHGDDDDKSGLRREDLDLRRVKVEEDDGDMIVRIRNPLDTVKKLRLAANTLWNRCNEITGDTYYVEGVNPRSGEIEDESRNVGVYGRVAEEMGQW